MGGRYFLFGKLSVHCVELTSAGLGLPAGGRRAGSSLRVSYCAVKVSVPWAMVDEEELQGYTRDR